MVYNFTIDNEFQDFGCDRCEEYRHIIYSLFNVTLLSLCLCISFFSQMKATLVKRYLK